MCVASPEETELHQHLDGACAFQAICQSRKVSLVFLSILYARPVAGAGVVVTEGVVVDVPEGVVVDVPEGVVVDVPEGVVVDVPEGVVVDVPEGVVVDVPKGVVVDVPEGVVVDVSTVSFPHIRTPEISSTSGSP